MDKKKTIATRILARAFLKAMDRSSIEVVYTRTNEDGKPHVIADRQLVEDIITQHFFSMVNTLSASLLKRFSDDDVIVVDLSV